MTEWIQNFLIIVSIVILWTPWWSDMPRKTNSQEACCPHSARETGTVMCEPRCTDSQKWARAAISTFIHTNEGQWSVAQGHNRSKLFISYFICVHFIHFDFHILLSTRRKKTTVHYFVIWQCLNIVLYALTENVSK